MSADRLVAAVSVKPAIARSAIRRDLLRLGGLTLIVALIIALLTHQPGYTDAYYYLNGAAQIAHGQGLTDRALWTYIGAPAGLPVPGFLYWMPLASLAEALPVWIAGGTLGLFRAGQIVGILCVVALSVIGYGLGLQIGGTRRTGWLAGLLTVFSGFFLAYWTNTDTFALYAVIGSLALWCIGKGRASQRLIWWIAAGLLAGLAHLTRADGLLFLITLLIAALWNQWRSVRNGWRAVLVGLIGYGVVMTPWFVRNLGAVGSLLPVGGFQSAWFSSYDQIAAYPPGASLTDFLATGPGPLLQTRLTALSLSVQTFVAVEGLIVLAPLILLALWRRRSDPTLSGVILYALGLHALMTLVFALAGMRGGLLHSAAALVPFWAALGITGLDDALRWAAKRRRWPLKQAQRVFGIALLGWAVAFSALTGLKLISGWNVANAAYTQIGPALSADAVIMVNDPPAFTYQSGLAAVVVPDSSPDVIPALVARYGVTYLLLDSNRTVPFAALYAGQDSFPFLQVLSLPAGVTSDPANPLQLYRVLSPTPTAKETP